MFRGILTKAFILPTDRLLSVLTDDLVGLYILFQDPDRAPSWSLQIISADGTVCAIVQEGQHPAHPPSGCWVPWLTFNDHSLWNDRFHWGNISSDFFFFVLLETKLLLRWILFFVAFHRFFVSSNDSISWRKHPFLRFFRLWLQWIRILTNCRSNEWIICRLRWIHSWEFIEFQGESIHFLVSLGYGYSGCVCWNVSKMHILIRIYICIWLFWRMKHSKTKMYRYWRQKSVTTLNVK